MNDAFTLAREVIEDMELRLTELNLRCLLCHGHTGHRSDCKLERFLNLRAKEPAPAMTEPVRVGVCPNCRAILGVPDSVRTYKDGRVRMYWECCGISVMSPAKAAAPDARFQQQKPDVPGTKLGLECVNQCGHTPDANTACWPCVEKALAKQLAELRERASRLINRSIESGYYSENSRLVLDDFAEQLLNGGANGTG